MLVRIQNLKCFVEGDEDELDWLYRFLSFKDKSAEMRKRMGYVVHDDHVRLFSMKTKSFPTGLLPVLLRQAEKTSRTVEVIDEREGPDLAKLPPSVVQWLQGDPWTLRDYQLEAIQAIAAPEKSHLMAGRGILWHPTGSGKGREVCAIAATFPGNWVFLVHRSHLARDIADRWKDLTGERAGWIGAGRVEPRKGFTVATMQTLHARLVASKGRKPDRTLQKWANNITGLMVDECHTAPARTSYQVLQKFPNAFFRLGLSGTPLDRGDKRTLIAIGCLGPILHRVRPQQLFETGTLQRPTVHLLSCKQETLADNWQDAYTELVVQSETRNELILKAMLQSERPGMVYVQRKEHGFTLAKMAERAGLTVRFVHGAADGYQRKKAVKELERARLDYIICTDVFTEGVNIPSLRTVILAGGGKSVIRVLQQIGRVTRTDDGKDQAVVYDIDDRGNKWLRNHSRLRQNACQREGFDVVPATLE